MSTEILSPVQQPSMLYPALYGIKPRRKDFRCTRCGSTNFTRLIAKTNFYEKESLQNVFFDFTCENCENKFYASGRLIVNEILEDQMDRFAEFTHKTGYEFGALIMRRDDGNIVLDMVVIGEDREVEMTPTHELRPDEEILGTWHSHPYTDVPSHWDIATFLKDDWEKLSMVAGAEGNFNVMIKTQESIKVTDIASFVQENEKVKPVDLANRYNFLYYRGRADGLKLVSDDTIESTSLEELFKQVSGVKEIKEKIKKTKRKS
jgi:hypothetical protein